MPNTIKIAKTTIEAIPITLPVLIPPPSEEVEFSDPPLAFVLEVDEFVGVGRTGELEFPCSGEEEEGREAGVTREDEFVGGAAGFG